MKDERSMLGKKNNRMSVSLHLWPHWGPQSCAMHAPHPPQCCICMSPAGPMNSPNRAARKRDPRRPHVARSAVNMWPYACVGREMPFFPFHSTVINLSGITALRECKSTHTQTPQRLSNAFNSAALVDPPGLIIAFSIHPLRPRWHIDPTP